jgi:hypothetical protein
LVRAKVCLHGAIGPSPVARSGLQRVHYRISRYVPSIPVHDTSGRAPSPRVLEARYVIPVLPYFWCTVHRFIEELSDFGADGRFPKAGPDILASFADTVVFTTRHVPPSLLT